MELKNFKIELSKDSKDILLKNFKLELTQNSKVSLNLDEPKELISKYIVKRKRRLDDWM